MDSLTSAMVAAVAAACSALASFLALRQTNQTLDLLKKGNQGQAMVQCIDEYRTIRDALAAGNLTGPRYFERLWSLQFRQYYLYRLGLIPKAVYVTWLQVRHRDYTSGAAAATLSERDGWKHAAAEMDAEFVAFVDDLLRLPTAEASGVLRLLEKKAGGPVRVAP
jgi:hypothetical protein